MRIKLTLLFGLLFSLSSCDKGDEHIVMINIEILNATKYNVHCIYSKKDYTLSDSVFNIRLKESIIDSSKILCPYYLDTVFNRDNVLTESEFTDFISKYKIYYIQNKDTFFIKRTFYDGKTYWKSDANYGPWGIIVTSYYWFCHYGVILSEDMFERRCV